MNKKACSITLQKDSGSNDYPQDVGTYTTTFEFFPPEMTNIQNSAQATTAYIHKQVNKDFTNHSKLLVQINNGSKDTPDYIYFTIHPGTATATPAQTYLIVYGVKDWSDNVDPRVYDDTDNEMFNYENNQMKMNVDINMNNNSMSGIREKDVYRNQNGKNGYENRHWYE